MNGLTCHFEVVGLGPIDQRSPAFLASGTGVVEDSFSMDWGRGTALG